MKARLPATSRLSPEIVGLIEQLAEEKAKAKAEEEFAKRESDYLRRILKIVCVVNNMKFGIGAKRALVLIQAISEAIASEDEELLWKHVDGYLAKMGLTFYESEDDS